LGGVSRASGRRIWDRRKAELDSGYLVLRETETIYEEASKLFTGLQEDVFRHGRLQEAILARIPRDERLKWLKGLEAWAMSRLAQEENHLAASAVLIRSSPARARNSRMPAGQPVV